MTKVKVDAPENVVDANVTSEDSKSTSEAVAFTIQDLHALSQVVDLACSRRRI